MAPRTKKKIARLSLEQQDVKSSFSPFGMIDEQLLKSILCFLLTPQKRRQDGNKDYDWKAPRGLALMSRELPRVAKAWHQAVGEITNAQITTTAAAAKVFGTITSPADLALIKSRVMRLDLDLIGSNFIKDVKEVWGPTHQMQNYDADMEGGPIEAIIEWFGGDYAGFAKLVAAEYRQFLVVKCIELLVQKNAADSTDDDNDEASKELTDIWTEKCKPSKIVDKFWHAHQLAPKKYVQDCTFLIGEIIDHDAGYDEPETFKGSDYESKQAFLFSFENHFPSHKYFGGRLGDHGGEGTGMLFGSDMDVSKLAVMIWGDMNEENNCG
jgi:hypothetical protein